MILRFSGRKLYAAMKGQRLTGVFSSPEMAKEVSSESVTEIDPLMLEGCPVSEQYVCMASGSVRPPVPSSNKAFSKPCRLSPVWALNPQSAAAAMFGSDAKWKTVIIDEFLLIEIDRVYKDGELTSVHKEFPFSFFFDRVCFSKDSDPTEKFPKTDYIGEYLEKQRERAQRLQRLTSPETLHAAQRLMQLYARQRRQNGQTALSGNSLIRAYRNLVRRLMDDFTQDEIGKLSVLLDLPISSRLPAISSIPFDEAVYLVQRAFDINPNSSLSRKLTLYLRGD